MSATINLIDGRRITVSPGEAERITDLLERDETAVIKVKPLKGAVWHVRPIDIASIGTST